MRKFFIFTLSLSLLIASMAFIYQAWRNESRKWQLDSFYAQQFEQLFEKKYLSKLPLYELEKLEQRMGMDGYNYEEVSHLRDTANLKKYTEAVEFCLETSDKKLKMRLEPEVLALKDSIDPDLMKRFCEPSYLEKFHKAYRKKPPHSYQEIDLLEKEMLATSYSVDEVQKVKQQALVAYQEELFTDYLTKVEIEPWNT